MTATMATKDRIAGLLSTRITQLGTRLELLLKGKNEDDRIEIHALVDSLIALDFVLTPSINGVMMSTMSCITKEVLPSDGLLAAKCCQLFTKLGNLPTVRIPEKTAVDCIGWCMCVLKECTTINVLDVLGALEVLFKTKGHLIQDLFDEDSLFIKYLGSEPILEDKMKFSTTPEIQLMVVKCMWSLLLPCEEELSPTLIERLRELLCDLLKRIYDQSDDIIHCLIVQKSFECLRRIFEASSDDDRNRNLGDILGIVKFYMFFGLRTFSAEKPQRLYPMALSMACAQSSNVQVERGAKAIRLRKGKTSRLAQASGEADTTRRSSDELPVPKSEMGTDSKLKLEQTRVRTATLEYFGVIVKETDHKVTFGFWRSFLPDRRTPVCHRNLVSALTYDPSQTVRMNASDVLITMLCGSRSFLSQAEVSEKMTGSFRPFSLLLGDMVIELHSALCTAVLMEKSSGVIVNLLRCIAKLIQNTTYHRLTPGLLAKVVVIVSKFISHKVWTVQIASLTALGSIISITPAVKEVEGILTESSATIKTWVKKVEERIAGEERSLTVHESILDINLQDTLDSKHATHQDHIPWILDACVLKMGVEPDPLGYLASVLPPVTVRVESFQVLTCLARNYFQPVALRYLHCFTECIVLGSSDTDINVRLHAGKTMEALGIGFTQLGDEGGGKAVVQQGLAFWKDMLPGPVSLLIDNQPDHSLHAIGCQCLAAIDKNIFELLDQLQQQQIVSSLVNRAGEGDVTVRSAAVHALGVLIHFPSVRDNDRHVLDITEMIFMSIENRSLSVQSSAAWSLSKLSEVLVSNVTDRSQKLPHGFMQKLLDGGIRLAARSEKLRVSCVRALGNLLTLINKDMFMKSEIRRLMDSAIDLLLHLSITSRNMKTRWNACYSLANMMKNNSLYDKSEIEWQHRVIPALMDIVKNGTHFKVRTSAAVALRGPTERWKYDKYFMDVWEALVNGLENSQNTSDYTEYTHQEQLLDEICSTICHLTVLLTTNDLQRLHEVLIRHRDNLPGYFKKFQEHVVPERADILLKATSHLCVLMESSQVLSADEVTGPGLLLSILVPPVV